MIALLRQKLFAPVDAAGLAVFRIMFGALMAWDASRYVVLGWIRSHYLEPELALKFAGFEWVARAPAWGMYVIFGIMTGAATAIALGFFYRVACVLFCLAHTYVFLVAAEYYLNHAYLISLWVLVMTFLPANVALSLDGERDPSLRRRSVPRWAYAVLMLLMACVYVYGSIAKMNPDWLAGEPVRHWLADRAATATPWIATQLRREATAMFISYTGVLFDLLVVPALLFRKTRPFAVAASLCFHLSNHYLFNIGAFPWLSLMVTTLFFEPDWPRRLPFGLSEPIERWLDGPAEDDEEEEAEEVAPPPDYEAPPIPIQNRMLAAMGVLAALQILLPLRHHLYPGDTAWNESGHIFSWRMKLRDKRGRMTLRVVDKATGKTFVVDPRGQLTDRQYRKATTRPDLLLYYVHYLRDAYRRDFGMEVSIYADAFVSLNYRPEQRFVDPEVDLAATESTVLGHNHWVTEFEDTPLPSPATRLELGLATAANRAAAFARRPARFRTTSP
ncbi:MAG: HTTM domain-containing protein [Myxococcales bacterium]|nr:HTTM domain-containing protein [Myxococcales bacterium]